MAALASLAAYTLPLLFLFCAAAPVRGTLDPHFYAESCPNIRNIVEEVIQAEIPNDPRVVAKMLRIHFHDCFVQGCDGSVLLDDVGKLKNEKSAQPNRNSLKGFEVVDKIKSRLEEECPGVVSCADILALAAEVSVVLAGGPSWPVVFGRRDSKRASFSLANKDIPPPTFNVRQLIAGYGKKGLDVKDMVTLSGGHSIGVSRCVSFTPRLYNQSGTFRPDPTLEKAYLFDLQQVCPNRGDGNVTQPLDFSPTRFDNNYYKNLVTNLGLLNSDQVLTTQSPTTAAIVQVYSKDQESFFREFAASMVKMGNISPLTGTKGEIRRNCRVRNKKNTVFG